MTDRRGDAMGTMGPNDFQHVADDPQRVGEIADAEIDALRATKGGVDEIA
ncbi:hypothetical protein [Burkholderia sp. 22088]